MPYNPIFLNPRNIRPHHRVLAWVCVLVLAIHLLPSAILAKQSTIGGSLDYPPDIKKIIIRKELIVALPSRDQPPFFYEKDGWLQGIDIDIVRSFARELKVGIRFSRDADSQDAVVEKIARKEADLGIGKLSRTFHRALWVRFSEPYLNMHHALALNQLRMANMTRSNDMRAVIQKFPGTIGVLAKTAYADLAPRNFPHAKIVEFSKWEDAVHAVQSGKIDAVYRDEFEIKKLMKSDPRNTLLLRSVLLTDTNAPISIAVPYDSHHLLSLVNLYLSQRTSPPSVDVLLKLVKTP